MTEADAEGKLTLELPTGSIFGGAIGMDESEVRAALTRNGFAGIERVDYPQYFLLQARDCPGIIWRFRDRKTLTEIYTNSRKVVLSNGLRLGDPMENFTEKFGQPAAPCRRTQGGTLLTLSHFLILGAILFAISVVGIFLNRKNLIIILMSIELMLLAVNMNFIAFSHYLQDLAGQVFVFFILTVAAAESAIGLAILVVLFRNLKTIHVDDLDSLKG